MPQAPSVGDSQFLFESDVVLTRIDTACLEALEIDALHLVGRRFQDHLVLMMFEQAVRVLPEPSVVGTPRRLHVRHAPWLRSEHAKERFGMRRACTDLQVQGLLQKTAL